MDAVLSSAQRGYESAPVFFRGALTASQDSPARLEALIATVQRAGHRLVEAPPLSDAVLGRVHDRDFLAFLKEAPGAWAAVPGVPPGSALMPNVYPTRHMPARIPGHPLGRAGYYLGDTATPLGGGTFAAALGSAAAAAHAARLVTGGAPAAYAVCRPSGHHAHRDMAQGFCFLNNAAIAATVALEATPRVAILDVDVHHGNGTQHIFYDRRDVFFASLHGDPSGSYPFFTGFADETGSGAGAGFTLNVPLPPGSGDVEYLAALDRALDLMDAFDPGILVVSLGLDAHENDRLGSLSVSTAGFAALARRLVRFGRPTVLVQEGGYTVGDLDATLSAVLRAFDEGGTPRS